VREAKKVEGFQLSLAPLSPVSIRKTTKLDQPRFVWMQDQYGRFEIETGPRTSVGSASAVAENLPLRLHRQMSP
jgi:hypothetical protein